MAVPTRITSQIIRAAGTIVSGGGIDYVVQTNLGVNYKFFINNLTSAFNDPCFCKSLDGGMTWGTPTVLKACTCTQISVWYDRWSGIDADLIHVVYGDGDSDDVFYRNINTASSDALSTEYTVFAGASTADGGSLSIARMRGGNLIVVGSIDAATEIFSRKSTDVGVNWSDITAIYESSGTNDKCIVMPGWGADNQDAMMFYYDHSGTEISVKYYDDSANSVSETSIATSVTFPVSTSFGTNFSIFSAAVDITNTQNLLVFWTAVDTANADLRCFKVTQSAQTETSANVVLNSTDDQGYCGISIFGSTWYVFYLGKSNGSQTFGNIVSIYYKVSTDGGTTWSSETAFGNEYLLNVYAIWVIPICYKSVGISYFNTEQSLFYVAPLTIPRASYQLGI